MEQRVEANLKKNTFPTLSYFQSKLLQIPQSEIGWNLIAMKRYNPTTSQGCPLVWSQRDLEGNTMDKHGHSSLFSDLRKGGELTVQVELPCIFLLLKDGNEAFAVVRKFCFVASQ